MAGTDVTQRPGLDLTRAPWQQWSADMVKLAKQTVLKDAKSDAEVYFCLALADSLELNPFANEVYFIRRKGKDGDTGGVLPYVGREGLVKKAAERNAYFEADTVRENDEFEIVREPGGTRTCRHRYGKQSERGEIVGAYAFLHFRRNPLTGANPKPGFFYAPLEEYLPTFDQQWKMDKSPWGNQRSAMIEKCAMIGAGRQRLNLAGVLVDAEVDRVQQQAVAGEAVEEHEFDWNTLDASLEVSGRLQAAVARVRELDPMAWPPAKLEMTLSGRSEGDLVMWAEMIERDAEMLAKSERQDAESASSESAGDSSGGEEPPGEGVTDAEVVPDKIDADESVEKLRARLREIEEEANEPGLSIEHEDDLAKEHDQVLLELKAAEDPEQGTLGV